jgi:hypothetical protein
MESSLLNQTGSKFERRVFCRESGEGLAPLFFVVNGICPAAHHRSFRNLEPAFLQSPFHGDAIVLGFRELN